MRRRTYLLVYLFYLAVTVVITYPLITVIGTRMIGHPFGDAYEYTHHIWWIKTALQSGQNPFFMPNLLYPDGLSAALLWSQPLQSFPAWLLAFVLPLPAAFNVAALLTLALNGWAMFFLARYLVGRQFVDLTPVSLRSTPPLHAMERGGQPKVTRGEGFILAPALIAGLVFMLYPAFQAQLGAAHTGLLTLYPTPLFLYMLFRLRDVTRARWYIVAGALLFMVSLWGSILLLIYLIAPITAVYFVMLLAARDWQALRRALATILLGGVFAVPFVVPLALATLNAPPEEGAVRFSASLLGIVSPSFYHPLFSQWAYNRRVLGIDPFEQASYVGVIAAALALIGVWRVREGRWWLLLALVAWVFSLGPLLKVYDSPLVIRVDGYATHVSLPWALFQNLPLISSARTPARFNFAVGFAVAVLVGYGAKATLLSVRKLTARRFVMVGLMLTIAFEYQFWWGMPTIPGSVPEPIAALAARDDIRAVFDIPWYHPLVNKDGMFLQTGHQQPMIIGQIARRSPVNPAKATLLQDTLDPALLDAAGVDIVILHKEYDAGEVGALARQMLGVPFYEDALYAVFNVPPTSGAAPGFTSTADGDSVYFYAPEAGSATLSGRVTADNRGASAALDGAPLVQWTARGEQNLSVAVIFAAGYHTIVVSNEPPCPVADDPALRCPMIGVEGLALEGYQSR